MIKIKNTDVYGFDAAIRGMRNPWNSWKKSDSYSTYIEDKHTLQRVPFEFFVGENDLALMKKLVKAGSDHSKFMRMINVTCDITAPMYWWKEFDTYKVGTVRNSCSTMHTITEKEFTLNDFSHEHLIDTDREIHSKLLRLIPVTTVLESVICELNYNREKYLETKDKLYWWQIIQLLPSSYNQRATVQLNYAVLRNMYHVRKNHPLDEWRDFCYWIETLPYSELITRGNGDYDEDDFNATLGHTGA